MPCEPPPPYSYEPITAVPDHWYPYTREKYRLFTDMMVHLFGRSPLRLARFALAGMKLEKYSKQAAKDGGR